MTDIEKRSRRPHVCLKGLLGETRDNEEDEIMKEIMQRNLRNGKRHES